VLAAPGNGLHKPEVRISGSRTVIARAGENLEILELGDEFRRGVIQHWSRRVSGRSSTICWAAAVDSAAWLRLAERSQTALVNAIAGLSTPERANDGDIAAGNELA
jgi:hypothetical protein